MEMKDLPISAQDVLRGIPETGIITLKTLFFKEQKARIEPTKDRSTGRLLGVPVLSDEDKKKLTFFTTGKTHFTARNDYQFNLERFEDRMLWAMAQHDPKIAMSFDDAQQSKDALFYVFNEDVEVQKELETEDRFFKAQEYVHKDSPELLIGRARLLGIDMAGESPGSAKKFLLHLLRERDGVARVLDVYEKGSAATTLVFYRACDLGVIEKKNGVFIYGTMPLGGNEDAVISYLQNPSNTEILNQIKKEINPEVYGEAAATTKKGPRTKQQVD